MAEPIYVNRTRFVSSLDNRLLQPLNQLAKRTRIPKTRLLDEAVEDLLAKYGVELEGDKGPESGGKG